MPTMTDPSAALIAFQDDLSAGKIPLQSGELDPSLSFILDFPNGRSRFIYLAMEGDIITAIAIMALVEIRIREPLFQLGVAVPEAYR